MVFYSFFILFFCFCGMIFKTIDGGYCMYKQVTTVQEQQEFLKIYREICQEQQFNEEESPKDAFQYVLLTLDNEIAGTLETAPYRPKGISTVYDFDFMQVPVIRDNLEFVWEADKVGLLKKYRKTGLVLQFVTCMMEHSLKHNVKYVVCLFEAKFYASLRTMGNEQCLYAVSDAFVPMGEKLPVVPTIINVEAVMQWCIENMNFLKQKV